MKSEQKKTSCCAERIYRVKEILCHNRLCQPELYLISIYRQKKICMCFFLENCQVSASEKFLFLDFFSSCMYETQKITALHKVCLMHFFIDTSILTWEKKICFKFKVLSQEQSLTPPILFKLSSLSSSNRHWAQRKNIKNPCAYATRFSWLMWLIRFSSCFTKVETRTAHDAQS